MATRVTFNLRFFFVTSLAILTTFGIIYFLHSRQVRSQSSAYLNQADLARDNKDERREIVYLERYLRAQPRSNETRERLARLKAKTAFTKRQIDDAYYLLEDSLRREPERDDLRRFLVEFAMDPRTSLMREAFEHLEILAKKYPDDAEIQERLGTYYATISDNKRAIASFQNAYRLKSDRLNSYAGHALMERERLKNAEAADRVIGQMIEQNQNNFLAHLYAFEYGRKYRKVDLIEPSITTARSLAKDDLDVILAYANWCRDEARRLRADDRVASTARLAEARAELSRGWALAFPNPHSDNQPPPQAVPILLLQAAIEAETSLPAAVKILIDAPAAIRGNVTVLTTLFDYQIQATDFVGAESTFAKLEKQDIAAGRLAYDRARLNFAKQEWLAAAHGLRQILEQHPSDQAFVRSVNFLLGRCYEQIGETDLRLEAYTRAIPIDVSDPLWVSAQLGQAEAFAALSRTDDALRTYIKLADREPRAWLAVARMSILQALRSPDPSFIDWRPAEEAVQKCQASMPDSTDAKLVKAELLHFQKKESESQALVDSLFDTRKKEPAVWIAKAFRESRDGNVLAGINRLIQGRKELDDPVDMRLAQAQLLVQLKDEKPDSKYLELRKDLDRYTPTDRRRLLHGLAATATSSGFADLGGRIWDEIVTLYPNDLYAHLVRFDRAFRANDESDLIRKRDEIARVNGVEGVSTRIADAFVVIWKERQSKDGRGLDQALLSLDRLERDRPSWARIAIGKALIYERQGKANAALNQYRKAVNLGESQPDYLRSLITLLAQRGQFDEAHAVLTRLTNDELGSPDAMRLAADVSLRADNPKRALELAAKAVAPDSKVSSDFLWKGRLLWTAGDRQGAWEAFRKAKDLNPQDPTGWLLLIETLAFDKRMAEAESVFQEARGHIRSDDTIAAILFTAQAHKLLGQKEAAGLAFQDARKKWPDNVDVLRAEADFLMMEGKMREAQEAWTRVIKLGTAKPDEKIYAENMLLICLALDPDYATARSAVVRLGLDQEGVTAAESTISKRTKAVVLSLRRDPKSKLNAIELFESEEANLTDNDRFLLAQWYFQVNKARDGQSTMTSLLSRPPADRNPLYLSFFSGWLLAQRDFREAEKWIAKLEKIEPMSLRTIELKVQFYVKQDNLTKAHTLVMEQAKKPNAKLQLLALIAEGAGLYSDAETLIKEYIKVEREKKTPDLDLYLAGFYARRGRLKDALDVCETAWRTNTSSPDKLGQLCIEALSTTPQVDQATLKHVAGWIEEARVKHPKLDTEFQLQQAYLHSLQGKSNEAIQIYERLATGHDAHPMLLNNLAFLLSFQNQHEKAIALIARAKEKGAIPELLDTEALILMARGKPDDLLQARQRLQEALEQAPTASIYFHLAQLEQKDNKREASITAWREAQNLKLKATDLHPLEQKAYELMAKEYN
jgi:tetratricopeptide (TPR) repeat protein